MTGFLAALGRPVLAVLAAFGRVAIYTAQTLASLARPPFYLREFLAALLHV
ncbi:MAG: ABC transporter permease, partial [Pseudorhodobacter sp.]